WTPAEDAALRAAVARIGVGNWVAVAQYIDGRTSQQCLTRYWKTLDASIKHGAWTADEDAALVRAVAQHGRGRWAAVARDVPRRTDRQCRERYESMLAPEVNRTPITPAEATQIADLVAQLGRRWSLIAETLGNRSDRQIRLFVERNERQAAR
ncbi:hypothetical protein CXG81DRAFT_1732, partial [Caulochytrium protostelioides]